MITTTRVGVANFGMERPRTLWRRELRRVSKPIDPTLCDALEIAS
jgi:hypothetical protein